MIYWILAPIIWYVEARRAREEAIRDRRGPGTKKLGFIVLNRERFDAITREIEGGNNASML